MTAETGGGVRVALVAGATRGAGRAIAVELARAGLFVFATGRSSRVSGGSEMARPETIEETGELITAAGGAGCALVVDHEDPAAVANLISAVERHSGRLDVLVNDIFVGDRYAEWDKPVWEHDWAGGLRMLQMGVHTHLITCRAAIPLMFRTADARGTRGLVVEMTDGTAQANFGVTEENWRDACVKAPGFGISESPAYVARGVAALTRADSDRWAGTIISARQLADAYGITDTDGSRPDCWGYLAAYGWDQEDGKGVDRFR